MAWLKTPVELRLEECRLLLELFARSLQCSALLLRIHLHLMDRGSNAFTMPGLFNVLHAHQLRSHGGYFNCMMLKGDSLVMSQLGNFGQYGAELPIFALDESLAMICGCHAIPQGAQQGQ